MFIVTGTTLDIEIIACVQDYGNIISTWLFLKNKVSLSFVIVSKTILLFNLSHQQIKFEVKRKLNLK